MPRLPLISGMKAIKAFSKAGWIVARQTGSHIIMEKAGSIVTLSVPRHRELDRGTLRAIIRNADLTVEEFVNLL